MSREHDLLVQAYDAFNARDLGTLATFLHPQVEWPDSLEGGVIAGRAAVQAYFERQLEVMIPDARIIRTRLVAPGRLEVDLQYAVRGLKGRLWSDSAVTNAYDFQDDLIIRMRVLSGL